LHLQLHSPTLLHSKTTLLTIFFHSLFSQNQKTPTALCDSVWPFSSFSISQNFLTNSMLKMKIKFLFLPILDFGILFYFFYIFRVLNFLFIVENLKLLGCGWWLLFWEFNFNWGFEFLCGFRVFEFLLIIVENLKLLGCGWWLFVFWEFSFQVGFEFLCVLYIGCYDVLCNVMLCFVCNVMLCI